MKIIRLCVNDSSAWIGGLYYKRNILFSLTQNSWVVNNYNIQLRISKENMGYFRPFEKDVEFIIDENRTKLKKIVTLMRDFFHRGIYEFPSDYRFIKKICGIMPIQWIPDFQHNHCPDYFSVEELEARTMRFSTICGNVYPLVLSSKSCLSDFELFYGKKEKVYVVPFVSYLVPELKQLTTDSEMTILAKYKLEDNYYACISNQFWQHKNHVLVLDAIRKIKKKGNFKFVFTGFPKDYRNPNYYSTLMSLFENPEVKPYVSILGFIDRLEQIAVMKHASFIIQPSLFEGWGTVVEDAKVLDKTILLSDIPVHREQMNSKCKLFDPFNSDELAVLIAKEIQIDHNDDVDAGIKDMYKRAKEYSKGFERLLRDQEGKR